MFKILEKLIGAITPPQKIDPRLPYIDANIPPRYTRWQEAFNPQSKKPASNDSPPREDSRQLANSLGSKINQESVKPATRVDRALTSLADYNESTINSEPALLHKVNATIQDALTGGYYDWADMSLGELNSALQQAERSKEVGANRLVAEIRNAIEAVKLKKALPHP